MDQFASQYFAGVEEAALIRTVRHCDAAAERMASPTDALVLGDEIPGETGSVIAEGLSGDVGAMWV